MRIVNSRETESLNLPSSVADSSSVSPLSEASYHELADKPVVVTDVLAQLHANMFLLEDLQNRLAFTLREVRYVLKV